MTSDLKTASAAAFSDAWEQYDSALERFGAGDVRDACGKAWNATRAATRAAALAHGEYPQNTNQISSWIRRMSRLRTGFEALPLMFSARAQFLFQEAYFDGFINNEDIPDLIHGTADYIRQVERLASS